MDVHFTVNEQRYYGMGQCNPMIEFFLASLTAEGRLKQPARLLFCQLQPSSTFHGYLETTKQTAADCLGSCRCSLDQSSCNRYCCYHKSWWTLADAATISDWPESRASTSPSSGLTGSLRCLVQRQICICKPEVRWCKPSFACVWGARDQFEHSFFLACHHSFFP